MTLEELRQAALESNAESAVADEIREGNFSDSEIENFIEILGEDGRQTLAGIFEEIAKEEFCKNPEDDNTVELFVRAGYDLKSIFEFVWNRACGYNQLREADVFCATLAEAYIGGCCGLPKDNQKAWEVFKFVAELSDAWSGAWVGALSVSLDRLLLNYMEGTFDDSAVKEVVSKIASTHFSESVISSETSNIYILHQFMVGNANQILNRVDFNTYVSRFIEGEDYVKATTKIRERAEAGDSVAQYNLGYCYDIGLGVTKNVSNAFQWYQKSAEQNNMNALYWVALCYINGLGTTKNPQKGIELLEQLVEMNDTSALGTLGHIYAKGEVCDRHLTKAKTYFRKAAELGNMGAKECLVELEGSNTTNTNTYTSTNTNVNANSNGGCMGMLITLITVSSSLLFALVAVIL